MRHLVMPDGLDDTAKILKWLAELHPDTYVNVMDQYHPDGRVTRQPGKFPELSRRLRAADERLFRARTRAMAWLSEAATAASLSSQP